MLTEKKTQNVVFPELKMENISIQNPEKIYFFKTKNDKYEQKKA